ncbi:tetratricopeptide repeat protein [Alicyclobacillus dauci]|uniref:Tetratricopeptide repeat-containing protein n=1 Tax=Alicyclobacillus dauci TaxID=1475485 RepID=A0ABY6YX31_9BACL|nr:hypothetical protein [Alicyclobacillus dauci]WAH35142.1 hypothetical protein NZD86_12520 [Alicyclobacillus dauci]
MENPELKAIAETIAEIRKCLPGADDSARQQYLIELSALRNMAIAVLDAWMEVDDAIEEALEELGVELCDEDDEPSQVTIPATPSRTAQTNGIRSGGRQDNLMGGPVDLVETWFDLSLKADCLLRKGLGYFDLHMYDEAANALSDAVFHNDLPATRIYLALSHLAAGRIDLATMEVNKARAMAQDEITAQAVLELDVQICAARDDWQQAIHVLYELVSLQADNEDIWFNLGVCHLRLFEFAAAERCFAKAMRDQSADVEAALWRALTLSLTDRRDEAYRLLQIAFTLQFPSPETIALYVVVQLSVARVDEAIATVAMFRAEHPRLPIGDELLALCFLALNRPDLSLPLCKRALTICPNRISAMALLGICSYFHGDLRHAREALIWTESMVAPSAVVQLILGRIDMMDGNMAQAATRFGQLASHPRTYARRLSALYQGMVSIAQGSPNVANAHFERAMQYGISHDVVQSAKQYAVDRYLVPDVN